MGNGVYMASAMDVFQCSSIDIVVVSFARICTRSKLNAFCLLLLPRCGYVGAVTTTASWATATTATGTASAVATSPADIAAAVH